jgi:hypothetical protein
MIGPPHRAREMIHHIPSIAQGLAGLENARAGEDVECPVRRGQRASSLTRAEGVRPGERWGRPARDGREAPDRYVFRSFFLAAGKRMLLRMRR